MECEWPQQCNNPMRLHKTAMFASLVWPATPRNAITSQIISSSLLTSRCSFKIPYKSVYVALPKMEWGLGTVELSGSWVWPWNDSAWTREWNCKRGLLLLWEPASYRSGRLNCPEQWATDPQGSTDSSRPHWGLTQPSLRCSAFTTPTRSHPNPRVERS